MSQYTTQLPLVNGRIIGSHPLVFPQLLLEEIPATSSHNIVTAARDAAASILRRNDDRLLVIVGPCSIHDPVAALEYGKRLVEVIRKFDADLCILMRVYFEKPRTTIGWKGLINDPDLDGSFRVNKGLRIARLLLRDLTELGVPVACEYLDTLMPQYTSDFVSWCAVGARTTESQLHREMASGLSFPVGFKNGTAGDVRVAVEACVSSSQPHTFLGITKYGIPAIFHSAGNEDVHVILRGSTTGSNYDEASVAAAADMLSSNNLRPHVMVDLSHGNSEKQFQNQRKGCIEISRQISQGSDRVMGVMIESHLFEGNQKLPSVTGNENVCSATHNLSDVAGGSSDSQKTKTTSVPFEPFSMRQSQEVLTKLKYGVSVTDGCVGWQDTLEMLDMLAKAVQQRRRIKNNI